MESSKPLSPVPPPSSTLQLIDALKPAKKEPGTAQGLAAKQDEIDSVELNTAAGSEALTVLADKIAARLNEMLRQELPEGLQSLTPEQNTPEAAAERIVNGSVGLLTAFSRQNPDLQGEELISRFMETIGRGIQKGYEEAEAALAELGAFKFDGVKNGIEETMRLVEEKLLAFEQSYRAQNNLPPKNGAPPEEEGKQPAPADPKKEISVTA